MKSRIPQVLAYGPSVGIPELRQAICGYYSRAGIAVEPSQVMITAGGSEAVIFAMMAICDDGDEIVCFEPFYTNYNGFATMAGVKLVPVRSRVEDGFHLPRTPRSKPLSTTGRAPSSSAIRTTPRAPF